MFKMLVAGVVLLGAACAAHATTYDAVADFAPASAVWSYGEGGFGAAFVALPVYTPDNCVGAPGLACHNDDAGAYTFPAIGKNNSGGTLTFYTNVVPVGLLFVQSLPGSQAVLRFTAPVSTSYVFNGHFERIDNSDGSGDGTLAGVFSLGLVDVSKKIPITKSGQIVSGDFNYNARLFLTAGSTVDFYLDALQNTNNDGTGLSVSVASVPEPATWALAVIGFGIAGTVLRHRRSVLATA